MKVFVIFALLAVAVAADVTTSAPAASAPVDDYVGEIQETEGGPVVFFGEEVPGVAYGPPSCKLGKKLGNPICFGKCISRGHAGGYCKGKVCTCVD